MDTNLSDLPSRLSWLLTVSGASARSVARAAGLKSPAHVGMIARSAIEGPRTDTVESIARALSVSPAWLAFGVGDPPTEADLRVAGDALAKLVSEAA